MAGSTKAGDEASGRTYDVFISHAGQQKSSFAAWLQRELQRHGVTAFLDETSLQLGEAADVEMEAALRSCSIVVAVLTPDFLRSSYCMTELHWALHPQEPHPPLQQKFTNGDSGAEAEVVNAAAQLPHGEPCAVLRSSSQPPLLMPVFHSISNIAALQQQMADQIAAAPAAGKAEAEEVGVDLAAACRRAGDRPDSHGKLDVTHVEAIVVEVLQRLDRPMFKAPEYAVDLDSRAQELLLLLQPGQPGGVRVLSLHGMGGIGKTTLARELFSRLSRSSSLRFSRRIFLEVGQDTPLLVKQRQLIEMLAGASMPAAGGAAQQQQQLEQCTMHAGPLLLILDDIWTAPQRNSLLCLKALSDGSRVLLTGRVSSDLHAEGGNCVARRVGVLAHHEAKRLLCQHAFDEVCAPPEYDAAVQQALAVCGGLPLALQVVGAGMRSRAPDEAEEDIRHMLKDADPSSGRKDIKGQPLSVLTLLRWSFDRLPTNNHKHFFLDAALLMRDYPQEHLLVVWAGILQQQQDDSGEQCPASPAQLRRRAVALWTACAGATLVSCHTPEDERESRVKAHDCIVEMAQAVREQSINLGWSMSSCLFPVRLPKAAGANAQALRLQCGFPGATSLPPGSCTVTELLGRHQQCQLAVVNVLPHSPRSWTRCMITCLCKLLGSRRCMPQRLLYLRLAAAPQAWAFGGQLLVLDVCGYGVCGAKLPASIAACSGLRHLRLHDGRLRSLPASIGSLASLNTLDISRCASLQGLPDSIGRLSALAVLDVSWCTSLQQLPDSVGSLSGLTTLDISMCEALQQLPDNIASLVTQRSCIWRLDSDACREALAEELDVSACRAL